MDMIAGVVVFAGVVATVVVGVVVANGHDSRCELVMVRFFRSCYSWTGVTERVWLMQIRRPLLTPVLCCATVGRGTTCTRG